MIEKIQYRTDFEPHRNEFFILVCVDVLKSSAGGQKNMSNNKSILYIIITAVCFGTMEIALKLGSSDFTALQMTFLRFFIGGLFLLPFALHDIKKRNIKITKSDILYLAILGLIGVCLSMTCFQLGVMNSNANTSAVIISANPVFTMIFAYFIIHEAFTKRKALVLLISIAGLIFVANPANMAEGNTAKGLLFSAASAITFSLFTTLGKLRVQKLGGMVQNSFSFLIASGVELIFLLLRGEPVVAGINAATLPVVIYTGIIVTGIGYFAYLKAIELAGPSNASIAFFIKPVIAVLLSAVILKEQITWNIVLGVILILTGSVINLRGGKVKARVLQ